MVASGTDIVVPRMCPVCATGSRKSSDNGVHKDHEFSQLLLSRAQQNITTRMGFTAGSFAPFVR
jgi:hypothetical protein